MGRVDPIVSVSALVVAGLTLLALLVPVDWLPAFNLLAAAVFVLFAALALGRMARRAWEFVRAHQRVPIILKRDIGLFSAFVLIFGVGLLVGRILGTPLSQNPLWVIPSSAIALITMGYWVWVEYHLEDGD